MTPTPAPNGALVGYARVSSTEQNLDLQLDALSAAGCTRVFSDTASGAKAERPGLNEALSYLRRRPRPRASYTTPPRRDTLPTAD